MSQPKFVSPILKVTGDCNFRCSFCRFAGGTSKSEGFRIMPLELLERILVACAAFNIRNDFCSLNICFHGGEPLMCGISYFEDAMSLERDILKTFGGKVKVENSIQTNGSLLTDEWTNFFKRNNFNVGVSIDGDSTINFHTGSGNPSSVTDSVVRRFQQLQASGVNCGVLSVITNSHKDRAKEFYNFCVQNRLNNIGLCKCLNEENGMTVRNDVLTAFLIDLFDLYFHGDYPLNIREFGTAIGKLLGRNDGVCTMVGRRNCGSYLTFDVHGNVFYCDTSYDLNQTIGNIEESSLDEVLCTKAYQERQSECASWYEGCVANCRVVDICGGGCHRDDVKEEGKRRNRFCETYEATFDHIRRVTSSVIPPSPLPTVEGPPINKS